MPFAGLRATMLDDPSWFSAFIETMTGEKLSWATTGAPHRFEEAPTTDEFTNPTKLYAEHHASR